VDIGSNDVAIIRGSRDSYDLCRALKKVGSDNSPKEPRPPKCTGKNSVCMCDDGADKIGLKTISSTTPR
jgi:hypothetical protein